MVLAESSPTEEETPATKKLRKTDTAIEDSPVETVELGMYNNCTYTHTHTKRLGIIIVGNIEIPFSTPTGD